MNENLMITLGMILPFLGTTLGSATVFFMKNAFTDKKKRALLGFAAGIMLAASIWSLLNPAIDSSSDWGIFNWFPATIGLIIGCAFFVIMENFLPKIQKKFLKGNFSSEEKSTRQNIMMIFAITLHNFPEGMAVGVAIASALVGGNMYSLSAALALSIGIAIQNFPEGAAVSLPTASEGVSKFKSFMAGTLSGIVEPISAVITILISGFITKSLPFLLAFAAGAMIYVVVEDLIPQIQDEKSKTGTIGVFVGFIIMMILDVMLG